MYEVMNEEIHVCALHSWRVVTVVFKIVQLFWEWTLSGSVWKWFVTLLCTLS